MPPGRKRRGRRLGFANDDVLDDAASGVGTSCCPGRRGLIGVCSSLQCSFLDQRALPLAQAALRGHELPEFSLAPSASEESPFRRSRVTTRGGERRGGEKCRRSIASSIYFTGAAEFPPDRTSTFEKRERLLKAVISTAAFFLRTEIFIGPAELVGGGSCMRGEGRHSEAERGS